MPHLPFEIILLIFELASIDDTHAASLLCLINKKVRQIITPILYGHVCLSGTDQVEMFNATIRSFPELGRMVHGITLLDKSFDKLCMRERSNYSMQIEQVRLQHQPSENETNAINHHTPSKSHGNVSWEAWDTLINFVGECTRRDASFTLVLSTENCNQLLSSHQWRDDLQEDGVNWINPESCWRKLIRCKLTLDHIIISDPNMPPYLKAMEVKKITYYCGLKHVCHYITPFPDSIDMPRTKQLEVFDIIVGDKIMNMFDLDCLESEYGFIDYSSTTPDSWPDLLSLQIKGLIRTQDTMPKVNIYLHVRNGNVKNELSSKLNHYGVAASVSMWGKMSDFQQEKAAIDDMSRRGWICGKKYKDAVYQ